MSDEVSNEAGAPERVLIHAADDAPGVAGGDLLGLPGLRAGTEPLARLVAAAAGAIADEADEEGAAGRSGPALIGLTGPVASGKSTTAAALIALLAEEHGLVTETMSTDGFLWPNVELERRGLTPRKGFPESYDYDALLGAVVELRAGGREVAVPVYDHLTYDVLAGRTERVGGADLVIVEGLNVLQDPPAGSGQAVRDLLDLGIYVDAAEPDLRRWYRQRVQRLRAEAPGDGSSFYDAFASMTDDEFVAFADLVWTSVNLPNLIENVEPTRGHADVVVRKAADHTVHEIEARSLRAQRLLAGGALPDL